MAARSPGPGEKRDYTFTALAPTGVPPGERTLHNTAQVSSREADAPKVATADVQLLVPYLDIQKTADKQTAEVGDVVTYSITVTNRSLDTPAQNVTVADDLPAALGLIAGSSFIAGQPAPDPADRRHAIWNLGTIPPNQSVQLFYRTAVGSGKAKRHTNRAVAHGKTPGGDDLDGGPAEATIELRPSSFADRSLIWGKVFWDENGDGIQNAGEPGLANVAVVLDDGTVAVTDEFGKYSIPELDAGSRVIRVVEVTLPTGATPSGWGPRFGADPASQFVSLMAGGSYRADFPVEGERLDRSPHAQATIAANEHRAKPSETPAPPVHTTRLVMILRPQIRPRQLRRPGTLTRPRLRRRSIRKRLPPGSRWRAQSLAPSRFRRQPSATA